MASPTDPISAFWRAFQQHASILAAATCANHPTYDLLLAALHGIDARLFFEFSPSPPECELIVTAEGNRDLFPLVHAIVAAAPRVDGWAIRALKPKIGFPVTATWEDLTVTLSDVVFEPLQRDGSLELGLRLFVPDLASRDFDDAHNALLRAIDHGLGEERHARTIAYTEVQSLPATSSRADYIPLLDLDRYVDWHEKRS